MRVVWGRLGRDKYRRFFVKERKKVDQGMVEHTPQKQLEEKEKREGKEGKARTRSNDLLPSNLWR